MNNKFDYLKESKRTLSDKFYGSEVKQGYLKSELINFSNSASNLDRLKKGMFYGRDLETIPKGRFTCEFIEPNKDIFHAIIGVATEAGELVDAYLKWMNDDSMTAEIDTVNLCEEIGDVLWYAAIIAREAGVSFEDIQRNNIEKLTKRFPDKFTEFNANNRDLSSEREILEMVIPSKRCPDEDGLVQQYGRITRVELPNSIEAEVGCISKAKLIEAFKASEHREDLPACSSHEEVVEWIFKNFA